jgi:hypothetical protein
LESEQPKLAVSQLILMDGKSAGNWPEGQK